MQIPAFTMTNESITVMWEGKPYVVQKGAPNFIALKTAIINEEWDKVQANLTVKVGIETWAKGRFSVQGSAIYYDGKAIPEQLNRRIFEMASRGEEPGAIFNFWERLQKNPSWRSVQQLWGFLNHAHIPLTPDGCFLAYKGVGMDYKDKHSGKFDNSPGQVHEMPRNQISDDPDVACHYGFHVGALNYAQNFGQVVVVCKVDPEHVVCVPKDSNQEKMRVAKYEVVGNHGTALSSTVYEEALPAQSSPPIGTEEEEQEDLEDEASEESSGEYDGEGYDNDEGSDPSSDDSADEESSGGDDPATEAAAETEKEEKPAGPKRKPHKQFDAMGMDKLMGLSIADLRQYATHNMMIVGASKIPGGKAALIQKILEIREGK